jgi:hypothetical protein
MERQYNHRKGRIGTRAQPSAGPHGHTKERVYRAQSSKREGSARFGSKAGLASDGQGGSRRLELASVKGLRGGAVPGVVCRTYCQQGETTLGGLGERLLVSPSLLGWSGSKRVASRGGEGGTRGKRCCWNEIEKVGQRGKLGKQGLEPRSAIVQLTACKEGSFLPIEVRGRWRNELKGRREKSKMKRGRQS